MSILINRIIRASNLARAAKKAQALMGATRLEAAEKSQGTIILLLFLCSITEL